MQSYRDVLWASSRDLRGRVSETKLFSVTNARGHPSGFRAGRDRASVVGEPERVVAPKIRLLGASGFCQI